MRVAIIDIGKPGKNLGWAIDEPDEEGKDLDACIEILIASLGKGPVALGFEAPQFVPVRDDPGELTKARDRESGPGSPTRPFSAGAGAAVLVTSGYCTLHSASQCEKCYHALPQPSIGTTFN